MERGRSYQYLIVSAVSTAAVTTGVSFSWATPVLSKIAHNEVGFPINNAEASWVVAISSIGFVVGCFAARFTSDRCGRRITILGSSLPIIIGTVLMIFAWEALMLGIGRFLWGCGTGSVMSVSALYIAEISDKEIRGRLSLSNRFMLNFGCLLVISVGAFVSYRTLNYMLLALPVFFFAACWWIPESPYYLIKEEKFEAARRTLQMLTGIQDEDVLDEKLSQMKSHIRVETSRTGSVKEFFGKRYRKAIVIIFEMKLFQILTGIHALQNYLGPILIESNFGMNITTALILFGTVRFLIGIMSSMLVDRLGRRPLMISSFFATGVVLAVVAAYYGMPPARTHQANYLFSFIPFIGIIIAVVTSVLGYESVAYLIPAELFPMNVKALALAMVSGCGGLINFLSVKTYQPIKDLTGLCGVITMYASAAFMGAVFSYFLIPETKGKSLREIQIELHGNIYDEEEKLNSGAVNSDKEEDKNENKLVV